MKAYVLLEIGWEYNDEIYYRPESEGGRPKKVFLLKKEAQDACHKLNEEYSKRHNSGKYPMHCSYEDNKAVVEEFFEVVEVEVE